MDELNFRQVLGDNDISQTHFLAKKIWEEHYIPIIGSKQVDYMLRKYQSMEAIRKQISKEGFRYYLILNKTIPIGYFSILSKKEELFLSKIYLDKRERGKGFGKRTLKFIEEIALSFGVNKIRLTVNKNNNASISTYLKTGFKNINSIVTDIGNGFFMDDYVMEKRISLNRNHKTDI